MMETRLCTCFHGGYAAYPHFTPEDAPDTVRMNDFYLALRDAVLHAASLAPIGSLCTADYRCTEEEDGIRIVYTLRLRQGGRTAAQRTLTHHWQNGVLVMPRKKRLRMHSLRK